MEQPDSMEVKVICCKDLKAFNFFQKLNIYVVVSIVNEGGNDDNSTQSPSPSPTKEKKKKQQQQKQKTPIDREGDGNPEWNHLMRFDLKDIFSSSSSSSSSLVLQFDLLSEGTILGDKTIGRVVVPFEDLINGVGGAVRFVSYQVRTTDGIPNGVLDFSFKPIFNHNPNPNNYTSSFQPFGGNNGGGVDANLIYPPPMLPSTNNTSNYYPPPPPPVDNPSPASESYYPKIDNQFDNNQIHYPTAPQIHSPPSHQFHYPSSSSHPQQVYYPQPQHPQPQADDYHQLPPSPYHHHHHCHHHSLPQVAYYPPPPPLYYPPTPTTPPTAVVDPYGHEFGRVGGNVAYDGSGYPPNYWGPSSTQPIHW